MREIKFRAWDKHNKQFIDYCDLVLNRYGDCFAGDVSTGDVTRVPNEQVQLYTGLRDKNGVEIYEGDIVQHNHFEVGRVDIGKVIYHKGCWTVRHNFDSTEWGDSLWDCIVFEAEVIGNIYEDSELLNEKNGVNHSI